MDWALDPLGARNEPDEHELRRADARIRLDGSEAVLDAYQRVQAIVRTFFAHRRATAQVIKGTGGTTTTEAQRMQGRLLELAEKVARSVEETERAMRAESRRS